MCSLYLFIYLFFKVFSVAIIVVVVAGSQVDDLNNLVNLEQCEFTVR